MKRKSFLVFVLAVTVFGLFGCARSKDPLDWEIGGKSPYSTQRWFNKNLPLMPEEVARELQSACYTISGLLPKRDKNSSNEIGIRLVEEIRGKTVREVILRGYRIEMDNLHARINNQSQTMIQLINVDVGNDPAAERRQKQTVARHQAAVDRLQEQLAMYEGRVAELQSPSETKSSPPKRIYQ